MMTNSSSDSQILTPEAEDIVASYSSLSTDDKLGFLYALYKRIGGSIVPVAPPPATAELSSTLLGDFFQLPDDEQFNAMKQIVNGDDSEYSRAYGSLTANNQLLVWYTWAQALGTTAIALPADYQPTEAITQILSQIETLNAQDPISVLREIASQMGYSDIKPIPSQKETGKTASL